MRIRLHRMAAALVTLALSAAAARTAAAAGPTVTAIPPAGAVPEPDTTGDAPWGYGRPAATPDTSHFLPTWLHLHASVGVGWISSPPIIRQRYEAGQDYEVGLETRRRDNFRMRLNAEWQVLPAVSRGTAELITVATGDDAQHVIERDTLLLDARAAGWLGAGRLEAQ